MEKGKNLNIWLASQIRTDFIPIGKGTRMRAACLISFAVFFALAGPVDYVCGYLSPSGVEIVPQNPTSCDIVDITLSGGWPDLCMPYDSTVSMVGNDIYIDVIWPDQSCPPMPTSWEWTESVGPLSVGTYTIYARLIGYPQTPEEYTQMTEFIVTDYRFVLSTESLTVPEGETATFTVAMTLNPNETIEVTIAHQSGDSNIMVESGAPLTFDSSNYFVPQTVTLAAEEDEDYFDGTALIWVSSTSLFIAQVSATEVDNDVPVILYVDACAPSGVKNGTSWEDAFTDLQQGLTVTRQLHGIEEIHVAQGVYTPAEAFGSRNATFRLIGGVAIKGGYAGFGEPDPNARDVREYETILSGDLNGDDGPNFANNDENSHRVVTGSRTDAPTVLDGFTVTAGNGVSGAGIYNLYQSNLTLTNCLISGNFARYGGGICIQGGDNIALTNCIISSNATKGYNHNGRGGGICVLNEVNVTMTNCTITGNSAEEAEYGNGRGGGGICSWGGATITLINCILWGNSDLGGIDESAQIYLSYRKEPHGAEAIINYCCIQGWTGNLGGTGNIGDEPLFVDSTGGNYHLSELSPCINAGDPNHLVDPNESDIDGQPRIIGGRVDMGADEFHCNNIAPIANAGEDQTVFGWIDGIAEVTLDGTGSYDDDGHPLTYLWSWTIDGETYTATGPSPIIELPAGEHFIQLIVNDRVEDSEPNQVVITVIEPMESQLWVSPQLIYRYSRMPKIFALLRLPEGVTKDQVDSDQPLLLYPASSEVIRQHIFQYRRRGTQQTIIFASFDKAELLAAVPDDGRVELQVVGQLKTGRYFYGTDTAWIIGWRRRPRRSFRGRNSSPVTLGR